jgi:hypothetical protein
MFAINWLHYSSRPGFSFAPVKLLLKGSLTKLLSVMPDNTSLLNDVGCKVCRSSKQRRHTPAPFLRLLCVAADRRSSQPSVVLSNIEFRQRRQNTWTEFLRWGFAPDPGVLWAKKRDQKLSRPVLWVVWRWEAQHYECAVTSAQAVFRLQHLSFSLPSCLLGRYTVSTGKE